MGVSFALPIAEVLEVAAQLRANGRVRRGDIGATTQPLTAELGQAFGLGDLRGALVVGVAPGGPADAAGIRSGDVLLSVNGEPRLPHADVEKRIFAAGPGERIELEVWRQNARLRAVVQTRQEPERTRQAERTQQRLPEARLGLHFAPAKVTAQMPAGVYVDTATGASLLAGIESGDRITAMNGIAVTNQAEFDAALESLRDSKVIALLVSRGGAAIYVPVTRRGK